VLIFIVLAVFVGPALLHTYDTAHYTWISCEVQSAHSETGSSVSRTGIGGSRADIERRTKGCGSLLLLRQGVTEANSERVATSLEKSGKVEIEVGSGSYAIRSILGVINRLPYAYGFRAA
jgi:hypothetical protein